MLVRGVADRHMRRQHRLRCAAAEQQPLIRLEAKLSPAVIDGRGRDARGLRLGRAL